MEIPFKKKYKLQDRINECNAIKKKHPDKIPIILTKNGSSNINDIKQEKFLIFDTLTIAQFMYIIRKRINLKESDAINIFISTLDGTEVLPATSSSVMSIYNEYVESMKNHKNYDGFLYIIYSGENVFG
jgi:GABA(A) receptor-associated protein